MDHEQAVQTQASLRYAMGELSPEERDAFEEHFADCPNCMSDVEMSAAFAANAKAVFRGRAVAAPRPSRLAWLRRRPFPALALSAAFNLMLVAGLGYQLLRVRPASPAAAANALPLESIQIVHVHGTTRGGESSLPVMRPSGQAVILSFDLQQQYQHYLYSIDRDGKVVESGEVHVPAQADSLNLPISLTRLAPGEYRVTATGTAAAGRDTLGVYRLQVGK